MKELYKKHRPRMFKQLHGQAKAVRSLEDFLKKDNLPRTLLFTGPSGTGKTTTTRILKKKLNCGDRDFQELNCADVRGIETVRDIRNQMSMSPIDGECRIWSMDECARLTLDAQSALLKILEDTPSHVYFMLATTDPKKLLPTILTRATEIRFESLKRADMKSLLSDIADKEKLELSEDAVDRLIDVSEGSARKALVILNQVMEIESEEEMLEAILSSDSKRQAIELARALINPRVRWVDIVPLLKEIEEDPENLRYMVLGYASSVLLGGGKLAARAFLLISCFAEPYYNTKRAGLIASCYEAITAR